MEYLNFKGNSYAGVSCFHIRRYKNSTYKALQFNKNDKETMVIDENRRMWQYLLTGSADSLAGGLMASLLETFGKDLGLANCRIVGVKSSKKIPLYMIGSFEKSKFIVSKCI